jgi:hypothetical protein
VFNGVYEDSDLDNSEEEEEEDDHSDEDNGRLYKKK